MLMFKLSDTLNKKLMPKAIVDAMQYLKSHDFEAMATGVYEIQGKKMFAQVLELHPVKYDIARFESHRDYIDLQFLVRGKEQIGFSPLKEGQEPVEVIEERDLMFYDLQLEDETFINMRPGYCAAFYPNDLHKPGIGLGVKDMIRKVVVKISTDLFY